jgi:hypothetical protein
MKEQPTAILALLALSIVVLGIEACSASTKLSPAGGQVRLSRAAAAPDCKSLGTVDDTPYGEAKLYVNMRNKAGEMGATYIMLTEEFHDKLGDRIVGTAYQCPPK